LAGRQKPKARLKVPKLQIRDELMGNCPPFSKEAHIWPYHSHTPEVVIGWPDIGYWVNDPSDNSDNTDLGFNMLYNEMILID
jgi:hypothetical protein